MNYEEEMKRSVCSPLHSNESEAIYSLLEISGIYKKLKRFYKIWHVSAIK